MLKLKTSEFSELILTFVEVTGKKLVGGQKERVKKMLTLRSFFGKHFLRKQFVYLSLQVA